MLSPTAASVSFSSRGGSLWLNSTWGAVWLARRPSLNSCADSQPMARDEKGEGANQNFPQQQYPGYTPFQPDPYAAGYESRSAARFRVFPSLGRAPECSPVSGITAHLHENLPDDDVVVVLEHGAEDDRHAVLLRLEVPGPSREREEKRVKYDGTVALDKSGC